MQLQQIRSNASLAGLGAARAVLAAVTGIAYHRRTPPPPPPDAVAHAIGQVTAVARTAPRVASPGEVTLACTPGAALAIRGADPSGAPIPHAHAEATGRWVADTGADGVVRLY